MKGAPPGWISAVVLVDGRVMGTWTQAAAGKSLRLRVEPCSRLPARVESQVREGAGYLARVLGLSESEVEFA